MPPGPAYSPQPLTLADYTQYLANLTEINEDLTDGYSDAKNGGKNKDKVPKNPGELHPYEFHYEVEYNTFNDS